MCSGARSHSCWCAVTVDGPKVARAVAAEVLRQIEALPDFDEVWLRELQIQAAELSGVNDQRLAELESEEAKLEREVGNLLDFLANGTRSSDSVAERLRTAEERLAAIRDSIAALKRQRPEEIKLPSADELRRIAAEVFEGLAADSQEFADIMRKIVDDFYVLPFRLFMGGHIQPRCVFTLNLAMLLRTVSADAVRQLDQLKIKCTVDLTTPPQYEQIRPDVVRMRHVRKTERQIATELEVTVTAVQHAAALQRKMDAAGITDPWIAVLSEDAARDYYARIRHERYRFEPLSGFVAPIWGEFLG